MSLTATPVFPQTPQMGVQQFLNADASNKKTIITAGVNGTKVLSLTATSTETANARVAQVWLTRSGVSYLLTSVNIPVNSGFDGTTASVNLMNDTQWPGQSFSDGNFFFLQSGDTLQVSMSTTITAGKEIDIVANYLNF